MDPICQIDSMSSFIRHNGDSFLTYTVHRIHDSRRAGKRRTRSFVFFKVIKLWTALNVQLGSSPTRVASPVGDDSTLVSGEPGSLGLGTAMLCEPVKSWKLVFAKFDRGSGTHLEAKRHRWASHLRKMESLYGRMCLQNMAQI